MHTTELWWEQAKARGRYVVGVVIGPRKCGKTTWFAELAAQPDTDVVLWKVLRVARAGTTDEVWSDLWKLLRFPAHGAGDDPIEYLEMALEADGRDRTLVVDDWDLAIERRGTTVSDACYEVLDALARFCIDQARDRDRSAFLGLLLLTSLPDTSDLVYFARKAQRATFERLSQVVTRSFDTLRFPMLDRDEARAVLADEGLGRRPARVVADECGGWLGLLQEAAAVVRDHDGSPAQALADVRDLRLPGLLHDSVYKWLALRHEVGDRPPPEYLEQHLAAGRPATHFGLPLDFDDPGRAAPLIRRSLRRTFLVVDTENLYMPFKKHHDVDPAAYAPAGFVRHLQPHVETWMRGLCAEHDVAPVDVWFVGRTEERIRDTVGPRTPGTPVFLTEEMVRKARRNGEDVLGHSDDTLMTSLIAQCAARHPMAWFVLVTGDMDAPMVLGQLGTLERVSVAAPWTVSPRLRAYFADRLAGRLTENGLGLPKPGEERR